MVWESDSVSEKFGDLQKYITVANDRLAFGADKSEVAQQLIDMRLDAGTANSIVVKIDRQTSVKTSGENRTVAEQARATRKKARP